jgi:hypothetical protein
MERAASHSAPNTKDGTRLHRALRREAFRGRGVVSTCVLACGAAHFFFWRVGMSYLATRKLPLALLVTTRLLSQPTHYCMTSTLGLALVELGAGGHSDCPSE